MGRLTQFLTNMDAKAWRSLVVSFVLFGGVGCVFLLGAPALGLTGKAGVEHWLGRAAGALGAAHRRGGVRGAGVPGRAAGGADRRGGGGVRAVDRLALFVDRHLR